MRNIKAQIVLLQSNIEKMRIGNIVGFRRYLKVRGVGYKFTREHNMLYIQVGFSHVLEYKLPEEIKTKFSRKGKMTRFYSKDLDLVTNILAYLRKLRKPDTYKGKGIRYSRGISIRYRRDPVLRKQGKKRRV